MGNEEMDNQTLTFKHLLIELAEKEKEPSYAVGVADIASLMETLQSCLLKYWEYDASDVEDAEHTKTKEDGKDVPKERSVDTTPEQETHDLKESETEDKDGRGKERRKQTFKKKPIVFLMDEAHKLPALVSDELSLKVFLDTLLVLTKQDRLCHVLLSTSDAFFQHFLRGMNVGHHAQIMTIGDCSKEETYAYFMDRLVETVPADLRDEVDFEELYAAFGGKLSHLSDYLSAWINLHGRLTPYESAIFIQAYTLLSFHLTHKDFETFSPLSTATAPRDGGSEDETRFSRENLLFVMRKLIQEPYSLPYFDLCRDIGTAQADAMIKTRILDLRWTKTVTPEQDGIERHWSRDGIERPIVLPMTRIVRRAMEVVLKEEDEHGRKTPQPKSS